jgi:hypothetical protein
MRLDSVNLLLAVVGILVSVLLAAASLFVAGIAIGTVLGVAISPYVGRASVRLAQHLGQGRPTAGPSHTLTRSDEQT